MIKNLVAILCIALLSSPMSWARNSRPAKETIGDILNKIENRSEKVSFSRKTRTALPQIQIEKHKAKINLGQVRPPSSSQLYYPNGTDEAELEQTIDEAINQLFKLALEFRYSPGRGEIWLRLAEQYVDKARLIEYRIMSEHDLAMAAFEAGKAGRPPPVNLSIAQKYNHKAIQLYKWFVHDFPNSPKMPQALFFLGYNYFQLGQPQKGERYYLRLTNEFPHSMFVDESNFALGDYYFGNNDFKKALIYYGRVASNPSHHLYSFAMYKLAWCYYKLNNSREGLKYLEQVILAGRRAVSRNSHSFNGVSRIRLATQAISDLIVFFAESGDPRVARPYFIRVIGPRHVDVYLTKLAYFYLDIGKRDDARVIFKDLIAHNPTSLHSYDFQYAIVKAYDEAGQPKIFNQELRTWIRKYGPGSYWQRVNDNNPKIIAKANQLMEALLRNHVLFEHEVAQKSQTRYAYLRAKAGYELYFHTFQQGSNMDEMHFFYAELLYDLGDYGFAADNYTWVVNNAPKSPYYKKSILDAVLAYGKLLPNDYQIRKMVGNTNKRIRFTPAIKAFEGAAKQYLAQVHKGKDVVAVKYRLGALDYAFNHFNSAIFYLNNIIHKYPGTRYAQYSANHLLDIYNLRHDYVGLKKEAEDILSIPQLANSKIGGEVREIKVKTEFKLVNNLEHNKNYADAAKAYEKFAQRNRGNALAAPALFNAAVNFERSNEIVPAIQIYSRLAYGAGAIPISIRKKSSQFLPVLYKKTGNYPAAARAYEAYAQRYPSDYISLGYRYNAAVIFDGLNDYGPALTNYEIYFNKDRARDRIGVLYSMAKIYKRIHQNDRAIYEYKKYLNMGPSNARHVIDATYAIAQLEGEMRRFGLRDMWLRRTVAVQRRLSSIKGPVGVSSAAKAKYTLIHPLFSELIAIHIPKNPVAQKRAITRKLALLASLRRQLKIVINYNDGPEIVASLTLLGQALENLYNSIVTAPLPAGLNASEIKQYQTLLDQKAAPFKTEALTTYQTAIRKGSELEAYTPTLTVAIRSLNRLKGKANHDWGTKILPVKMPDTMGL